MGYNSVADIMDLSPFV